MKKVLVVGAGRVGRAIAHVLGAEPDHHVRVADVRPSSAARVAEEVTASEAWPEPVETEDALVAAMEGQAAVVSAAPFAANPTIAAAASRAGVHYLDLTEDVEVTRRVREIAESASTAFVPQCGVAPGFVAIAGVHVIDQFDTCDELTLRVGALPEQPNNRLKYNLTWSTEGLVNEYVRPCEALRKGELTVVPPLEGREEVVIEGVTYEAFTTSGGAGSLCAAYAGKIGRMDYKTMRYPGHLELVRFLLHDLRFRERPDELVKIFHNSIPATRDDFVIISIRGLGTVDGIYEERTWWRRIHGRYVSGSFLTGIELCTSAGACGVLHLLLEGALPRQGFVPMEEISFDGFMATPFGRYYARPEH